MMASSAAAAFCESFAFSGSAAGVAPVIWDLRLMERESEVS